MHVEGAPDEVFAFIADCENERPWNPDLIDMGSMRIRVDEYAPTSHIVFRTTGSRMNMRFSFDIVRAADGGSDVGVHADMSPKGMMRIMSLLLSPMMRRTMSQRPEQMAGGLRDWKAARTASPSYIRPRATLLPAAGAWLWAARWPSPVAHP